MSENRKVFRAAGLIGGLTMLSRVLGMLRDVVLARLFGASGAADAFYVALRIPNTLRRFFGEGTLTVATVPVLREIRINLGDRAALDVARNAWWTLFGVLMVLAALGSLTAPQLIRVLAPGFADDPEKFALAGHLLSITFPYMVLIGLVGLAHGVLNAFDHFFAPAFHPALFNLVLIAVGLSLAMLPSPPIEGMAWAVLLGGAIQLGLHLPYLAGLGMSFRPLVDLADGGMRKILGMMGPGAFGVAIYQANIFVGTILASLLVEGSVAWLYYADRLFQLPLGIFVIALGTAVLPTLSAQAAEGRAADLAHTLTTALRGVLFVTVPSAAGLIVLALPVVAVIFQQGVFEASDSLATARALGLYAWGLIPVAAARILAQVFYSFQDMGTPMRIAAGSFAVNLVASLLLMGPMAHGGLALATSIAAWFQLVVTFVLLKRRYVPDLSLSAIAPGALRTVVACTPMVGALLWGLHHIDWIGTGFSVLNVTALAVAVGGGVGIYVVLQWAMRSPELRWVTSAVQHRLARRKA